MTLGKNDDTTRYNSLWYQSAVHRCQIWYLKGISDLLDLIRCISVGNKYIGWQKGGNVRYAARRRSSRASPRRFLMPLNFHNDILIDICWGLTFCIAASIIGYVSRFRFVSRCFLSSLIMTDIIFLYVLFGINTVYVLEINADQNSNKKY